MYPPSLPAAKATILEAMKIADVPPEVQIEILRQTRPANIRKLFMKWNMRSRVGKRASSDPLIRPVESYLKPDTNTVRDDIGMTWRAAGLHFLICICTSSRFIFLFFLISALSFSVPVPSKYV